VFQPLIVVAASSGPTPTCPCLPCAEGSRAEYRTPRGVYCVKKYFRNYQLVQTWLEKQAETTVFKYK